MLKGKVAVITGGSRGLGEAIACKLASMGADIAIVDIGDPVNAAPVCEKSSREYGVKARAYSCDVSDFDASW